MFARSILSINSYVFLVILLFSFSFIPADSYCAWQHPNKLTVICYMNGDNNLAGEVLHAVDMLETVGSSDDIEILALIDGQPGDNGGYGSQWQSTRFLRIEKDTTTGVIRSPVLDDLGEQDLGDPLVLEEFVKKCQRYPSEKYVFLLFAHGRGIIDTQTLDTPKNYKSLFVSPDETGQSVMSHQEFRYALERGLADRKFDIMLLFSCLSNMVEIGYELRNVTNYLLGSQDEIRLVNTPEGTYQIRGIEAEKLVAQLADNFQTSAEDLGKIIIDSFIGQYEGGKSLTSSVPPTSPTKYAATLSLVDCQKYEKLGKSLNNLAKHLITSIIHDKRGKETLKSIHTSLQLSQNYPSFLNMEYYDLYDFLENLGNHTHNLQLKKYCRSAQNILKDELVLYEGHTQKSRSHGVSIFLPNFLIPQNIYNSHVYMYKHSRFAKEYSWLRFIDTYRVQMLRRHGEILLDNFENASRHSDFTELDRLNNQIPWVIQKDMARGDFTTAKRYLALLQSVKTKKLSLKSLDALYDLLTATKLIRQEDKDLLQSVKAMLAM